MPICICFIFSGLTRNWHYYNLHLIVLSEKQKRKGFKKMKKNILRSGAVAGICKSIGTCAAVKYLGIVICMVGVLVASVHQAESAPTLFGDNGHYYDYIEVTTTSPFSANTWSSADTAASASLFMGVNGHLATITSAAENTFVFGLFSGPLDFQGAWLGGKAGSGWLAGPEDGDSFSYTNWGGSEPNGSGYAYMHIGMAPIAGIDPGEWADSEATGIPNVNDPVTGYFVEYEVPEPSLMLLLGISLLGVVAFRMKFKKI